MLEHIDAIAATVVGVVGILIIAYFQVRRLIRDTLAAPSAAEVLKDLAAFEIPSPVEIRCSNCKHWDHDAGQRQLHSSPTFARVMQVLTPNDEMGAREYATDETGMRYVSSVKQVLPRLENRWEFFGGCRLDDVLRHRTDKCERFEAKP